ncbi:MAG: long-chain fatty acid--CoA ligase [Nevskiaceae bacterium]|nr:MAG: long-chain fatty acid--CoA ligase [Nevskiaceae bacterium]TBR74463.1 MAG: long-chain fatty acid--CoA ligase [Nevskiaceae bacterium]
MSISNPAEKLLERGRVNANQPFLHQPVGGHWRTYTWGQVADTARRMATALQALGLPAGSRVAISGVNTAHWFMADFACGLAGLVGVGLYPKQAEEHIRFILEHSEAKAIVLGPMPDVESFLRAVPKDVLLIGLPYPGVPQDKCQYQWDELVASHEPIKEVVERGPDDLWSLIYTSGTTGNPKGVMISAKNLEFSTNGLLRDMPARGEEVFLSYLPLAHAFERGAIELGSLYLGAQVYFLESLDVLGETLRYVRPTRFFGVPLVWTRVQGQVLKQLPQEKLNRLLHIPFISALVKRKLKKALGMDRCWFRVSGAAALPTATLEWYRRIGLEIYQGYGMTENAIYCSVNLPGANKPGSVGRPYIDSLVRIDGDGTGDGEILNRHDAITPGYFKDPEKTAALFTQDGWLKTGDVGHIDSDGFLWITGRVKEIFKTAKGKYVAPAPIEGALAACTDIEQLCFVGNGLTQPIMLVTLSEEGRSAARDEVGKRLTTQMQAVNATLEPHERIAKIVVVKDEWTIDNGLVTPTMKVKRAVVEKHYQALLQKEINIRGDLSWEV